jgi:hypothetical protein
MNKLITLFAFIGLLTQLTIAQDTTKTVNPIQFKGIIFDSDSFSIPLKGVNATINNQKGFSTDQDGNFSIAVFPNDTINFTYVGYHPLKIYIPDTLKGGSLSAKFFMVSDTINLAEHYVFSDDGYENFKKSFLDMEVQPNRDLTNAKNNIYLSLYEAKTTQGNLTAEDNTKNAIKQEEYKVIYKGFIPEFQMVDVVLISTSILEHVATGKMKERDFYVELVNLQNQSNLIYSKSVE